MPKVSIWFRSYNHEKYIAKSLDSILAQTFADYEIMIADDCSEDGSMDIIRDYAARHENIHCVEKKVRGREPWIDQYAQTVSSEYLAFAHSDDFWEKTKLEKQVARMDAHPEIGACFTLVQLVDEEGRPLSGQPNVFDQRNRTRHEWLRYFLENGNCLCQPTVLIRRSVLENRSLSPMGLDGFADFYRWVRLCLQHEIYVVQERLAGYRIMRDPAKQASAPTRMRDNRLRTEWFLIAEELYALTEREDIRKVFPESVPLLEGESFLPEFVISQMLLRMPNPALQLKAMEHLYGMLRDERCREELERVYNYTNLQFADEKMRHAVFRSPQTDQFLECTLYYDDGSGFREDCCRRQIIRIKEGRPAEVRFDLSGLPVRKIRQLRFDPDEGNLRRFRNMTAVDERGRKLAVHPINADSSGEEDVFTTEDPQYRIEGRPHRVVLRFETELLEPGGTGTDR